MGSSMSFEFPATMQHSQCKYPYRLWFFHTLENKYKIRSQNFVHHEKGELEAKKNLKNKKSEKCF